MTDRRVLYVIGCGARPAADLPEFAAWSISQGWDTCVILTPSALKFGDPTRLAEVTGHPARSDYKRPEEPDVLPAPDAFAVAPCTFNTVGKWAAGISDTLALGLLNEALGAGRPIVAVPNPHVDLAKHPAFGRNVEFLRGCGVQVLFDPERYPLPNGSNDPRAIFPWDALKNAVREMRGHAGLRDHR
jgi:phosphopantothenoylcysteine synthetase/decarboxylase